MNTTPNRGVVLLVEDDENDAFFFQRAFKKAGFSNDVQVVRDGIEAVAYLSGEGEFADRRRHPLPDLVLLDLKLPRRPGLDVLRWIRSEVAHREQIVVVLTSSTSEADLAEAYHAGANSYLLKPVASEQMLNLVQLIGNYWIRENRFPIPSRSRPNAAAPVTPPGAP